MSEAINEAVIKITADASGVEAGLRRVDESAARTGRNLDNLGRQPGIRNIGEGADAAASTVESGMRRVDEAATKTGKSLDAVGRQPGFRNVGEGADAAAGRVDRSAKSLVDSIVRTTAAMQAGSRGTAEYYRALASQRGINSNALAPYLRQLEMVTAETDAAAKAQQRLDEGTRFLSDLKSRADGIGKTASQLAEMRAAQLGVSDAAGPMIARLREAEEGATGFTEVIEKAKGALAGLAIGAAVVAVAHQVVDAQREFDKLNASLETATGSSEKAAVAFKALRAFAANTPFDLKQTTEAFLELRNLGLTPSERALTSFGNTAAAKSMELKDVVAAVADAATGEFERLKEAFGITSQQIGDNVAFTFQGTTTLVEKDAKAIEEYLTKIGEVQFAGAMERQANTLNGAIGQLGDTWSGVMRTIAANGIGAAAQSAVLGLSNALQDLAKILEIVGGKAKEEGATVQEATALHTSLTLVFQGLAISGVYLSAAFKEVGQELAALAAVSVMAVKRDLDGIKTVIKARNQDAVDLSNWVTTKTTAIAGYSQQAAIAQQGETKAVEAGTKDRLAQFGVELTAKQKQMKAKQEIADIEKRLTGVDPQTAADLKKVKEALDAGAISQKEYAAYTAKINKEATENSAAYKDQVKALDLSAGAIKRRADMQAYANAQDREHLDFLRRTSQLSEEDFIGKSAGAEVKALEDQKKSLQQLLAVASKKIDNKPEQEDLKGQIDKIDTEIAARRKKEKNDLFEMDQRNYREAVGNSADVIEKDMAELASLRQQTQAQLDYNEQIGLTRKQVAALTAQRLEEAAARKDAEAYTAEGMDLDGSQAARIRDEAKALRERAAAVIDGAAKQEIFDKPLQDATALVDIMSALDDAAQSAAQGMAKSFGSVGEAIGGMTTALTGYERTQAAIAAQLASSIKDAGGDPAKIARANTMAAEASAQAQVKSYGDMASAAKGFFKENSTGYKVMEGVEKAYRATELAMALTSTAKKIFFKQTEVTANTTLNATKLGGEATTTAASTALAGTEASAWGVTAVVKAIASMPFPLNLAAGAATLAAVVAIGAKMVGGLGGGGMSLSEQRQQDQGTGTVLGDSSAKSESISRAIEAVEKNTYQDLAINSSMLATLRSIDSNITSFASQLVRTTDVTSPDLGTLNSNNGLATNAVQVGTFAAIGTYFGPIGTAIGALVGVMAKNIPILGKIATSIFGGKQSVTDSGITMSPTALSELLSSGASLSSYADVKTSGGWFSSDKNSTQTTALDAAANAQITALIKSMADGVETAGELLGLSGDDFTAKLNSFVVDIGEVSLKDLKGDDLQKALEAVFSKLGDQIAQYAVGGLEGLQQVGEGYLETLVRVASEYQTVDVVFQSFGKTFGAVGLASIEARDRLVQLAGGLDEFTSQGEFFLTNFFSEKEQAEALRARIEPTLAKNGLSSAGDNADELFRKFIIGLDTTTTAGAQTYTELMSIAPALKTIVDAQKDVLEERQDLQEQLDELTLTSSALLIKQREKERAALDATNRALYDQVKALEDQKAAIEKVKTDASTLLGGVDDAFSVLQKVVTREKALLQERIDSETEAVTRLKSLTDSISSTLDSMSVSGSDAIGRQAAQAQIKAALASVQGGAQLSDDQIKDLGKAFSAVTQDSTKQFGSKEDYLFDMLTTRNDIAQLGDVTGDQLSAEEKSLEQLKDQSEALDNMLTKAQDQIDLLKGISTTGLSIEQALYGLQTSIVAAQQNSVVSATEAITKAYQDALGRNPDSAGMEFWQNQAAAGASTADIVKAITNSSEGKQQTQIQQLYQSLLGRSADASGLSFYMSSGASISDIAKAIKDSDEYKKLQGIPGYAAGGAFGGGLRIVGENGPELEATGPSRIWSSNQTAALLSRASSPDCNNAALVEAVRDLRSENAQQRGVIERMAKDMASMATILKGVSPNGTFIKTKV